MASDDVDVHASYIDPEQWSYEEVEGIVSNKDDPSMQCFTLRAVVIGLSLSMGRALYNVYISYKTMGLSWVMFHSVLFAYVLGLIIPRVIPNQARFTMKEHALIVIIATTPLESYELLDPLNISRIYSGNVINPMVAILFCCGCHLTGYGFAGLLRRFLIWPSDMIWPDILQFIVLFRTLYDPTVDGPNFSSLANRYRPRRHCFLFIVSAFQFIYQWISGLVMPVLRQFSWMCMIQPKNRLLAQLTGFRGLGIVGSLQLDGFLLTSHLYSPVVVPRWALINMMVGLVLIIWIGTSLLYYLKIWDSQLLSLGDLRWFSVSESRFPVGIDQFTLLDNLLKTRNTTLIQQYKTDPSLIRFPSAYIIQTGANFLVYSALIVHTILYHGKVLQQQLHRPLKNRNNDIHCKLMSFYLDIPEWWFYIVLFLGIFLLTLSCHFGDLLKWYNVLLAIGIAQITVLPLALVIAQAAAPTSHFFLVHSIIATLIAGGSAVHYSAFNTIIAVIQPQTIHFLTYLKFSHYMKIEPRAVFTCVLISTILSSGAACIMSQWVWDHIPGICTNNNPEWSCADILYNIRGSMMGSTTDWSQFFGINALYHPLIWFFLIGALLPIFFWCLSRYFPNNICLKRIHIPLIASVCMIWNAAKPAAIFTWLSIGLVCSFALRKWAFYHYAVLFVSALSVGGTLAQTIMFFVLPYMKIRIPDWWGLGGPTGDGCPLASDYSAP